jgi:DNA-binding transcriptional LysR family regulator
MNDLEVRQLRYFVAVAEELHFGRAAERLHIAQPSLSHQIRRLEDQLAVTLLERNSRNVHLTPAGQAMLTQGRKLLNDAQHAIRTTRAAAAERLKVGFYGSAANALLPDVLSTFGARQPGIDVSVRELLLGGLDDVVDGEVDIAFTRLLPGQADLAIEVLSQEPRLVALASTHPLIARKGLTFADLRDESFIVNPAIPQDGPPPRWLDEQRRRGLPARVAAESASIQEILTLVAAARGVCLLPATVAENYSRPDVTYLAVTDADPAVVSVARRHGQPSPAVEAFIQTAREVANARRKQL